MIRTHLRKAGAVIGVAGVSLRRRPRRTLLAIAGVALAVLAVTVLASVGFGVLETGQQKFDQSGRDLWVSGGPLELKPQQQTPIQNSLVDSHQVAAELTRRDDVAVATPMAFQALYVGRNASQLQLLTGAGLPIARDNTAVSITKGEGLPQNDPHYANGSYDGPMTNKVIIDPQTADYFNVSVGDELYIGGSRASARKNTFTVVGVSPTFSRFLGSKTVILHLSELQELSGTTGADRASLITIRLQQGANTRATQAQLQEDYPDLRIQTNREQLRGLVGGKGLVIASAIALVILAVVSGFALTVNLLFLTVSQQRHQLAILRAIGLQSSVLTGMVGTQGLIIGTSGGIVGLALTPVSVATLNRLIADLIGFESLLQTPSIVYLTGVVMAVIIGTGSAITAGWYLSRTVSLADVTSAPR